MILPEGFIAKLYIESFEPARLDAEIGENVLFFVPFWLSWVELDWKEVRLVRSLLIIQSLCQVKVVFIKACHWKVLTSPPC